MACGSKYAWERRTALKRRLYLALLEPKCLTLLFRKGEGLVPQLVCITAQAQAVPYVPTHQANLCQLSFGQARSFHQLHGYNQAGCIPPTEWFNCIADKNGLPMYDRKVCRLFVLLSQIPRVATVVQGWCDSRKTATKGVDQQGRQPGVRVRRLGEGCLQQCASPGPVIASHGSMPCHSTCWPLPD